ncbi:MAG: efflux RND transporter periplasmic adaptor subunit [Candidatus Pelagadaptatus aseana]|uniref:efflux RND transporter periplasmic adaptor subunit n=1 Tax=Candidatus Pelagadaptatus aseana TaxID=3120508 RepID=UPI0039B24651
MNTRRWLVTAAICLALFAALALYKTLQIKSMIEFAESFPEPSETVETATARELSLQTRASTLGQVVAPQTINLRNELEGRITRVNFTSGSQVDKGQLLLQLDVAEELARLEAAEARLKLAKVDLDRVRKLRKNRTVSEERLDQAEAQYDIAHADIAALQATIDKKTLRAPFAARTGLHTFEVGQLIATNTLITTLVGTNQYRWVDFTLPLGKAQASEGTRVIVSRTNGERFEGEIVAMDSVMSANSRNRRYRARVDTEALTHNSAVNVSVTTGATTNAIVIPATAVRRDGLGDYVYVLEKEPDAADNAYRAKRRQITLMPELQSSMALQQAAEPQVAISKGLKTGDKIATKGSFKLREGLLTYTAERKTKLAADSQH